MAKVDVVISKCSAKFSSPSFRTSSQANARPTSTGIQSVFINELNQKDYTSCARARQERSLLVSQLNEPNEEFLKPYPHLPKLFHESPGNEVAGKTAEEVVETHKRWVKEQEVQWNDKHAESGSKFKSWPGSYMFVIAGDQASPHPASPKDQRSVRAASAAGVVNVTDVSGWDSEGMAEDEGEGNDTTGGAGRTNSSEKESTKRPPMTLPTKSRPAEA
ncbi:hypothetical protein FIBSPDRAFT_933144 [Athelia psychrophila]|uniref:Uncharacterized protein n=1 Tax=Athelia psychrophila TaxID=1759441 RepID=A0A166HJ40_9AGAM|nr:hypothetical protein FIBSPDRAFT_933144 [Fibularhizoctonia sp. CBS 109695]